MRSVGASRKVFFAGLDSLTFWQDAGKHYKCGRTISTLGFHIPRTYYSDRPVEDKPECPHPLEAFVQFGAPKHFKNHCDSKYGEQNRAIEEFTKKEEIKTMPKYCGALQTMHQRSLDRGTTLAPEEFIEWWPADRQEVYDKTLEFTPASLGGGVTTSFSYGFKCADRRRKNWRGSEKKGTHNHYTALECRRNLMSTAVGSVTVPVLKVPKVAEEAEDAEDAAAAADDDVDEEVPGDEEVNLGEWNGWRVSYARQQEPELKDYLRKVETLERAMTPCLPTLVEARSKPSLEEMAERRAKREAKRKERLKNVPKRLR